MGQLLSEGCEGSGEVRADGARPAAHQAGALVERYTTHLVHGHYTAAWALLDPWSLQFYASVAVYTEDAVFRSHPFRDAQTPREYALQAFGEEESAEFRFGEPVAAGDRAAVAKGAARRRPDGARERRALLEP